MFYKTQFGVYIMANDFRFLEFRVDKYGVKRMTQEELAKKLNLTRSRIVALEQKPDVIPTREDLQAYCSFFDTTADYLLGIRDTKTVDENIAMISKVTGLSEQSIDTLKKLNSSEKEDLEILNFIMSNYKKFDDFLYVIRMYINKEYNIPLHYDSNIDAFVESELPEIHQFEGPYFSIGKKYEHDGATYIKPLHIVIDVIESYAMQCIQEDFKKWKEEYQDERK